MTYRRRTTSTKQERTRARVERRARAIARQTLFVPLRSFRERERLRGRVFYSGAGDYYLATAMAHLGLAAVELMRLRRVRYVTLRRRPDGTFELVTPCR